MSLVSKALTNVTAYTRRWAEKMGKRYHRVYDDRDAALGDALLIGEARSNSHYPYVTSLVTAILAMKPAQNYGLVITGANFIGDSEKAVGSTADSTGEILFTAVLPGAQTITVTLTDDDGAITITADRAAGTIAIDHNSDTAANIIAALNADPIARYMVIGSETTSGAIDADETVTVEDTGSDPGTLPVLHIGGVNVTGAVVLTGVYSYTDTAISFDINAAAFSLAELLMLRLWVDDVFCYEQPVEMDSWEMDFTFAQAAASTLPLPLGKDMQTANITGGYTADIPVYVIASDATSEAQAGQLTFAGELGIDVTKNPVIEGWIELTPPGATLTADERMVFGLCGAHANAEDALDSVTMSAWFRVEGASLNILVEADDNATDTDDQDSGIDLVKGALTHFMIDLADLSDIKFYVDGKEQSGTAVAAAALTGYLQPILCFQRDAGAEVNALDIKRLRIRQAY